MGDEKGHRSKGMIWHWLCDSPLRGASVARGVRASSATSPAGLRLCGKAPERAWQCPAPLQGRRPPTGFVASSTRLPPSPLALVAPRRVLSVWQWGCQFGSYLQM